MGPSLRRFAAACAAGFLLTACGHPGNEPAAAHCQVLHVPVRLHGAPDWGLITGDYCFPHHPNRSGAVLLMAAGGAENADYWDMPGLPRSYSLAAAAEHRGYASLAIDRLGTGRSTRPASSTSVTYSAQVETVHQVASYLRHRGKRVVGVGHSLGSGTLVGVAARHPHDLDALVLTGYGPAVDPRVRQRNARYQVPARGVAARWGRLDSGYLTVRPEGVGRAGFFYAPATSRTALRALRNHLGTLSSTELTSRPQGPAAAAQGAAVRGQVLIADGQFDANYCLSSGLDEPPRTGPHCAGQRAFHAYEQSMLPHARLTTRLIPGTGHATELQRTAPGVNSSALDWISAALHRSPDSRKASPGRPGPGHT